MANLTQTQQDKAKALGCDPSKAIDWTKLLSWIEAVVQFLSSFHPTPTPGPAPMTASPDLRSHLKSMGCPDDQVDHCCACMQAASLALQSAQVSMTCCSN